MTILNHDYIKNSITRNQGKEEVAYRWSHGATDMHLGDGLLIYSLIQFHKFKNLVCLGSGGGFIPRIMTQARYDLSVEGFYEVVSHEWGDNGSTYVVDACNGVYGEVDWQDKDSFFRRQFSPKFLNITTEEAYYEYFVKQGIKIDLLHIDADHKYDSVERDFKMYSNIMSDNGIITIHDTDRDYVNHFVELEGHEGDDLHGPSDFVDRLDKEKFEVMSFFNYGTKRDFPSSSGLTMVRKK